MIDYLRKTSEAMILFLIVVTPWAFGSVHEFPHYCVTAGLGLTMLFWAIELMIEPKRILTRYQIPLVVLVAIVCLQLVPLGGLRDLLSPAAAAIQSEMIPDSLETLADGSPAPTSYWSAQSRLSLYPANTLHRGYWLVMLALLFTRIQDLSTVESLRRLCLTCLINGSILSYFAVFQHFATDEPGKIYWTYQSMGAAFGPFINRNHFAFYMNICFGLSLGLVGSRLMGKIKSFRPEDLVEGFKDSFSLWMVSVLVFMLGAVILCSSRGGLVSLFGGTLITAVFIGATGSFQRSWKWFALATVIFALAAAVQTWLGFDFVTSRYAMDNDNRTGLWLPLLGIVAKFPVVGTGLGTLAYVEPLTRTSADQMDAYLEYAHNEYLQLALETGVPGFLCGVGLLVLLAGKIASRIRRSRHNAWLYVGSLFGLSTIALHSFVEFGFAIPAIALLAVVLCGHIAGLSRLKPQPAMASGIPARIFAVVLVLFTVLAVRDAKRTDTAKRYWLQAERAQHVGDAEAELGYYERALAVSPNNVELLLDCVGLQFDRSQDQQRQQPAYLVAAQQRLLRVRDLCPLAAETHFLIGLNADEFQQADAAMVYFDRSHQSRKADPTLWFITGQSHWQRDDFPQAAEHFQRSLSLDTRHLPEILEMVADRMPREMVQQNLLPATESKPLMDAAAWFERRARADAAANPDAGTEADAIAADVELAQLFRQRAVDTPELQSPDSGELHYRKAQLLLLLDRGDEAVRSYKLALNYEPQKIAWRMRLAAVLGELGDYKAAHQQIKRVLQSKPNYRPAVKLRDVLLKQESSSR